MGKPMNKLSFKEYLESKQQLLKTLGECPIQSLTYNVTKYCRLIVGENNDKKAVLLKPGHTIIVEWQYQNVEDVTPQPLSIRFEDSKDIDASEEFNTPWKSTKLAKWLSKNSIEI
jgi:hypothetical protein